MEKRKLAISGFLATIIALFFIGTVMIANKSTITSNASTLTSSVTSSHILKEDSSGDGEDGINGIDISIKDGKLDTGGLEDGNSDKSWTTLFSKYKILIVALNGLALLTIIGLLIWQFVKLANSSGNPNALSAAKTGILITLISAAGIGSVEIIVAIFYNFLK